MNELSREEIQQLVEGVAHWHHRIEFPHGIVSPGVYDPGYLLQRLGLGDLTGKRVLDIGTRDGFFAFACEKLGAEVVAIDSVPLRLTGFESARRILGSRVEYVMENVYELTPARFGTFDVILFLGVLYHLRHPLLALDRLREVCRGTVFVESLVCDEGLFTGFEESGRLADLAPALVDLPIAQFLAQNRFHRDWTNKWSPNVACLKALLEDALFAPQLVETWGSRALVKAEAVDASERRRRIDQDRIPGAT